MDKKALKVFRVTIVGMLIVCALVFYYITAYMTKQNTNTLNQVADTYMQGMSVQIQSHLYSVGDAADPGAQCSAGHFRRRKWRLWMTVHGNACPPLQDQENLPTCI